MDINEILKEMDTIFKDILEIDEINLKPETTADMVEGWSSLTHIEIVVAIEKHFKCRFTSKEIQSWNNVGEMVDCIISKK